MGGEEVLCDEEGGPSRRVRSRCSSSIMVKRVFGRRRGVEAQKQRRAHAADMRTL